MSFIPASFCITFVKKEILSDQVVQEARVNERETQPVCIALRSANSQRESSAKEIRNIFVKYFE